MINDVTIVGIVLGKIIVKETENKREAYLTLSLKQTNKNTNIKCTLRNELINCAIDNIFEGEHIGIKGHLEMNNNILELVVDKFTIAIK